MSEEELQAQNEPVEETNVEESPTSEEPTGESTPQESSEPKAKVEEKPQEPKPTRSERRIKQLLEEKKALKEEVEKLGSPKETTRLPWEKEQPLIDPNEEYIDPQALEKRLQDRVQKEVQKVLEQQRGIDSYKSTISEHERGLQEVLDKHPEFDDSSDKYDPDLAAEFIERYQDANYLPNGAFVPRRSPAEVAEKVLKMQEKLVTRKTTDIAGKLAKQGAESAVTTRASEPEDGNTKIDQLYENAIASGDNADWAEYFKALSTKK
ncbi:MAG: hypothetical protein ACM3SR_11415 [Ignavibacteriales bacterium]